MRIVVSMIHQESHDHDTRHLGSRQVGKAVAMRVELGGELENHAPYTLRRLVLIGCLVESQLFVDLSTEQHAKVALQCLLLDAQDEMAVTGLEVEAERNARRQDAGRRSRCDLARHVAT